MELQSPSIKCGQTFYTANLCFLSFVCFPLFFSNVLKTEICPQVTNSLYNHGFKNMLAPLPILTCEHRTPFKVDIELWHCHFLATDPATCGTWAKQFMFTFMLFSTEFVSFLNYTTWQKPPPPMPFTRISNGLAGVIHRLTQMVKSVDTTTSLNPVPPWQGSATFKNKLSLNSKPELSHFFSCLLWPSTFLCKRFDYGRSPRIPTVTKEVLYPAFRKKEIFYL